jgi:hypothetical protein
MAHGGSMFADGGNTGRVKVGVFSEADLRSGADKKAIEKAQQETGLTYIDNKVIKKGGKMFMEVYLVPTEEYLNSNKFENGGGVGELTDFNKELIAERGYNIGDNIVFSIGEKGNTLFPYKEVTGHKIASFKEKGKHKDLHIVTDKGYVIDYYAILSKYAKGGGIEGLKVGSKVGFLRPRIGRYEWAEVLSIDGDNVNLVVRHPKRKQWDNYFTETKQRIEKYINTVDENWHDGRGRTTMKIKYEHGGSMYADGGNMFETPIAKYKEVSGKVVGSVPVSEEVYSSQVKDFVEYVYEVYEDYGFTKKQVKEAVDKYIKELGYQFTWGGGDSLDRERVYEYLRNPNLQGIKNPSFANGGSMSKSYEIGDIISFNSVMGGTKTGAIVSKLGEDGFRIKTEDGFATVKKSAIV